MHKPFLTYSQQISKLKNQKKLTINDEANAIEILHNIGYFSLIGGYKNPFINPMTRIYNPGTTFDDIFALYTFDKELREIVFKYLCEVEQHIRESISYAFCSVHGEMQAEYLNPANFDSAHARQPEIDKLIRTLDYIANKDTDHEYIVHQRKVHKNVPLWVAMKVLTFGQISHFYMYLPHSLKAMISKEFVGINEAELGQYLRALLRFKSGVIGQLGAALRHPPSAIRQHLLFILFSLFSILYSFSGFSRALPYTQASCYILSSCLSGQQGSPPQPAQRMHYFSL